MSIPMTKCTVESMKMIFENSNIDDDTKIKFLVTNYESMRPFKSYLISTPKVKKYFDFLCTNKSAKKTIGLTNEEIKFCIKLNPNAICKLDLSKYTKDEFEEIIHCAVKREFNYNYTTTEIILDNAKLLTSREVAILISTSNTFSELLENNKFQLSDDDWRTALGLDTGELKRFYRLKCDISHTVQKEYFIATCKKWTRYKDRSYLFDHLRDIFNTLYKATNKEPLIDAFIMTCYTSNLQDITDEIWTNFFIEQINNKLISAQEAEMCGAKLPKSVKLLSDI